MRITLKRQSYLGAMREFAEEKYYLKKSPLFLNSERKHPHNQIKCLKKLQLNYYYYTKKQKYM